VELDLPPPAIARSPSSRPTPDALELRASCDLPKHPEIDDWAADPDVRERLEELRSGGLERSSRDAEAILCSTPVARWRAQRRGAASVLISPVVDGRFGETAVLGIPEHDRTDSMIAERLAGKRAPLRRPQRRRRDPPLTRRPRPPARPSATRPMTSRSPASARGNAHPIVYCEDCGPVPVPAEQLPVLLPLDITPPDRQPARGVAGVRGDHLPALRRARSPRDRHARLPLRCALVVGARVAFRRMPALRRSRTSSRWQTCATGFPQSASSPARTAVTSCSTSGSSPRRCATSVRGVPRRRRALRAASSMRWSSATGAR